MERIRKPLSAIVLAGGLSSRMGRNKAELQIGGMTFIEHQVKKLQSLGIENILLSGYSSSVSDAENVPDLYRQKGPLGGIYSCLCAAENENVFVISVDAPFCPPDAILGLIAAHESATMPITMLEHHGQIEPLISVFNRSVLHIAKEMLEHEQLSVMRLAKNAGYNLYSFNGNDKAVENCNTPQEFEALMQAMQN